MRGGRREVGGGWCGPGLLCCKCVTSKKKPCVWSDETDYLTNYLLMCLVFMNLQMLSPVSRQYLLLFLVLANSLQSTKRPTHRFIWLLDSIDVASWPPQLIAFEIFSALLCQTNDANGHDNDVEDDDAADDDALITAQNRIDLEPGDDEMQSLVNLMHLSFVVEYLWLLGWH